MLLRVMPLLLLCVSQLFGANEAFDSTIPVVDMKAFYDPATKQQFVDQISRAMHEVGFFAVINPDIDQKGLEKAYRASQKFFKSRLAKKNEIYDPSLNGQRGYIPSETAQGQQKKDFKEFLHIGRSGNLWPRWMNLKDPMLGLIATLDRHSEDLQRAFALAIGEDEEFFVRQTKSGDCLLRALHYPANPAPGNFWAAKHTDIDLFTILPMATEEGLQIYHEGKWIPVKVPPNAFIVNGGDMLQNLTNGYFKSSLHQVVAKPDVERYSIVYFIHPRNDDPMDPIPRCIAMTDGVAHYPKATRLEMLSCRLRELGLASPELLQFERDSGIMDRIKALIDAGTAAPSVRYTYAMWLKGPNGTSHSY